MRTTLLRCGAIALGLALASPALATFHLMQIQQVIGGVNGDVTAQAIQLRMRSTGESNVALGRLIAYDATGANPVLLLDLTTNVTNGSRGDTVLIASANFAAHTSPPAAPDFIMTNLIPAAYLGGGSLTWEADTGTIYWRVSWGNYTGSNSGSTTNDRDGNFGPPVAGALPSGSNQALLFQPGARAKSTSNANDYRLTTGAAVFKNNARQNFTISNSPIVDPPGDGTPTDSNPEPAAPGDEADLPQAPAESRSAAPQSPEAP